MKPAALSVVPILLATSCADRLFYWPNDANYAEADQFDPLPELLTFRAPDGPELSGWWLPAANTEDRGTVVYCHGNSANLTLHVQFVSWLTAYGFNVLVFDYRGYGSSEGSPTRAGTVADALAAIDVALERDPQRTVVFGHSLGGAIGIVAAADRPAVRGVIAESTFVTYREIAASKARFFGFLVPFLISGSLDPGDVLDRLPPRPLLVLHGDRDRIVPLWHGKALFHRAHEPKRMHVFEGTAHRTAWFEDRDHFEALIVDFLDEAISGTGS